MTQSLTASVVAADDFIAAVLIGLRSQDGRIEVSPCAERVSFSGLMFNLQRLVQKPPDGLADLSKELSGSFRGYSGLTRNAVPICRPLEMAIFQLGSRSLLFLADDCRAVIVAQNAKNVILSELRERLSEQGINQLARASSLFEDFTGADYRSPT